MTDVGGYSALIVDDNWYNRDLSKLALKHKGYEVTEAINGVEALEILSSQRFNLMVLDLAMPGMDGATLLRTVRSQPCYDAMSIVVMTANPHMITDEVDSGTDLVMNKPIDVVEFAKLIERLKQRQVV